jgi:hypothetical protein
MSRPSSKSSQDAVAMAAMRSCRIRIVATFVSVTLSTPIFARDVQRHPYQDHGFSRRTLLPVGQTKIDGPSWCLRNYSADTVDCSLSDRAQCAETASGGLGECMPNYSSGADVLTARRRTFSDSVDASANERDSRIDGHARAPQTLSRHHRHPAAADAKSTADVVTTRACTP